MIRKARPDDWIRIHEICCRTANLGNPIEVARWPFFGELWTGPYRLLRPDWAYVFERDGEVRGYLTGCPDTARFERERRWKFTLPLFWSVLRGRFAKNGDTRRFLKRSLRLAPSPESCFSSATRRLILEKYPAHLHVNLESGNRGTGGGRALIEAYRADLQSLDRNGAGIHLYCGALPVPFYEKTGFKTLEVIDFAATKGGTPVKIFAMGRDG